jgi:endoglucanase
MHVVCIASRWTECDGVGDVMRAVILALAFLAGTVDEAHAERVLTPQATLWVDPDSSTAHVNSSEARRLAAISSATWLTGADPRGDARNAVEQAGDAVPVLVAYNIPGRDCGSYSKGGAKGASAYRHWIDRLALGIGNGKAAVIVEPDALASGCTSMHLLRYAVTRLAKLKHTGVYLDAGHSHWQPARTMARRLRRAAISKADGFALNVSNYRTDDELIAYARQIGPWHYVIDTSRNGQGPWAGEQDWCNPPGRGLGERPTTITGTSRLDAKLWIKTPGESDGACTRGTAGPEDPEWGITDPAAGAWFGPQADDLIRNANPSFA